MAKSNELSNVGGTDASSLAILDLQRRSQAIRIQLVAMSATVGNIEQLAAWFDAKLYISTFRPIPLIENIVSADAVYDTEGVQQRSLPLQPYVDLFVSMHPTNATSHPSASSSSSTSSTLVKTGASKSNIAINKSKPTPSAIVTPSAQDLSNFTVLHLCVEGLSRGQQVLLFNPTKQACQQICEMLLKYLPRVCNQGVISHNQSLSADTLREQRLEAVQSFHQKENGDKTNIRRNDNASQSPYTVLQSMFLEGLAYHHAGLNHAEREGVEKGFKSGLISILAATSTLAAGVNLPAGRVLIRSLQIGRDELSVTSYKQMTGRAGRAGQGINGCGESFLVVNKGELHRSMQLVHSPLPNVDSQINPTRDGNRGLTKAILEIISLELCITLGDVMDYVRTTLLFEIAAQNDRAMLEESGLHTAVLRKSTVLSTALNCINFLTLASAIEIVPPVSTLGPNNGSSSSSSGSSVSRSTGIGSGSDSLPTTVDDDADYESPLLSLATFEARRDHSLSISRFGRAVVQSAMNPDEAIVVYKDLLRAQRALNLESNLHTLYLVTPLEHNFAPDFKKLLKWYDRGKQFAKVHAQSQSAFTAQGDDGAQDGAVLTFVGDAIGLSEGYHYLAQWTFDPPKRELVDKCYDHLKQLSLQQWDDASQHKATVLQKASKASTALGKPLARVVAGQGSSSVTGAPVPVSIPLNRRSCEFLCKCKRIWAALLLHEIISGQKPWTVLAEEYHCQLSELEHLRKGACMVRIS